MALTTFTSGQVLTAAQMNAVQANDYNQTVSTKTASYTLVAADKGTRVVMNSASATTITVNTSLFSAGDTLILQNINTGVCTVTAGTATVSTAGSLAIPQNGSGVLYFTSAGVSIFYPSAGVTNQVAIFNETQASGTNGGTATSGSFVKRTLNTTIVNEITGCSIASSVITLPAGTYVVQGFGTAFGSGLGVMKTRLRNTTDATTTQQGTNAFTTADVMIVSEFNARFVITASKNFEVQTQVGATVATNGYGPAVAFGDEVYSQIIITKVA